MKIAYKGEEIILYDFEPLEAYNIARKLELEGINFYTIFAAHCDNKETKAAIEYLLLEERDHLRIFENKIVAFGGPFEEMSVADEVDTTVFGSFGESVDLIEIVKTKNKAIDSGILFEKRSISFMESCLEKTVNSETREAFEDIIKEERRHIDILRGILSVGKVSS
ncbi:MAG: ferritin family protein [Candidatus Omnitrophota bacterium]